VVLSAETPGVADLSFLLDGQPLGEVVSVRTGNASVGTGVDAVFTRTLPADLQSGSYLVEIVTTQQPSLVLASGTIEVMPELPLAGEPTSVSPPVTTDLPGLTVALAVGGAAVVVGAGFGISTRYRRKTIVRRIGNPDP
jgi:hypothetical protein